MKSTTRKYLNLLIKTTVLVLLCWVLYQQVFARENIDELKAAFLQNFTKNNLYWLMFAIILMPVNWTFETLKWRELIYAFERHPFWISYRAVWAGVTLSLFTPNRVGEYGGRILFVKPKNNWKTVIATLVGSFSQLLVLISMGILGLIYFASTFREVEAIVLKTVFFLGIALIGLMLFCFFNIDIIIPVVKRIPFIHYLRRFTKHVNVLRNYHTKELSRVLFYAFARYLIYSFQYYLMLRFFGIDVPLLVAFSGIATIFLFQTSIPLPPLMGLLARGELALYVWQSFTINEINILAATFSLFVLNLIIPALIGLVFIVNVNVLNSLGFGEKKQPKEQQKELAELNEN